MWLTISMGSVRVVKLCLLDLILKRHILEILRSAVGGTWGWSVPLMCLSNIMRRTWKLWLNYLCLSTH